MCLSSLRRFYPTTLRHAAHLYKTVDYNSCKVGARFLLYICVYDSSTELNETVGGKLTEFIQQINSCYPPEIVEYYSPNYSKRLLEKIEDYAPAL
mmetsp:Transcript_11149/g.34292  ORF Transcript_11149/g.34292 Transcript_11149/m.34292 type:complete len:95 (+) Transcript_11149:1597-1881(+)